MVVIAGPMPRCISPLNVEANLKGVDKGNRKQNKKGQQRGVVAPNLLFSGSDMTNVGDEKQEQEEQGRRTVKIK